MAGIVNQPALVDLARPSRRIAASDLVNDQSPQLGGVLEANGNQTRWAKGADIASASPLVLGTDGNYFDVTGTTGFSQITCTAGTFFMVQFDAVLTMTDGANLDLGGLDITTVAGDRALFFAIAANTAQLLVYKEEGNRLPSPDFISTEQTVAADALLDIAHGLSAIPPLIQVVLRCTTANIGYSVNDELVVFQSQHADAVDTGVSVGSDSTNVFIIQGATINLKDKSTFNDASITVGSWRWVARAWL